MRFLSYLVIALAASLATVLLLSAPDLVGPSRAVQRPTVEISYSDFISILLTIVTIVLGALALGVGVVAFWTIGEIRRDARSIATSVSKEYTEQSRIEVMALASSSVAASVDERLPREIDQKLQAAIEVAGKTGRLDAALERALTRLTLGTAQIAAETQAADLDDERSRE